MTSRNRLQGMVEVGQWAAPGGLGRAWGLLRQPQLCRRQFSHKHEREAEEEGSLRERSCAPKEAQM